MLISTSQEWPPLIDSGRELYDEPALANRLGDIVLECLKDIDPDADSLEAIQHGVTLCCTTGGIGISYSVYETPY